jgi:hypothetical protein
LLMRFYIDDAGEGGLRQWLHFSKTAPFPCTGDHKTRNEQTVGLHFDFARRLLQSYILKLLDRWNKRHGINDIQGLLGRSRHRCIDLTAQAALQLHSKGGIPMNRPVLLGPAATLLIAGLSVPSFGQALAESALTHAFSSTATTQAGSTLGRSLNQATAATQSRIATTMSGRIQPNAQRPGSPNQPKMAAVPKTAMGGTMGLTIRGGQVTGGNTAKSASNATRNVSGSQKQELKPGNTLPITK